MFFGFSKFPPKMFENFLKFSHKYISFSKRSFLHSYNAFYDQNSIARNTLELKSPKFVDIQKAFDSLIHSVLINKYLEYGIDNKML